MARHRTSSRRSADAELEALRPVAADPHSEASRNALGKALGGKSAVVVARAAKLVKDHQIEDLHPSLVAAFQRFLENPVKSDPNCLAKLAILEALDYTEADERELFVRAAAYVQLQPAWGGAEDAATGVRSRGLLALARLNYPDFDLLAAEALADPEVQVRLAALEALAHHGGRGGAALALFKLRLGDADSLVTLEAMNTLVSLVPQWGVSVLRERLMEGSAEDRELAAVALGRSRTEAGLVVLLEAMKECAVATDRAKLMRGVALHRSDGALAALLEIVVAGRESDAVAALQALAIRRFEPGVEAAVREAVQRNRTPALEAAAAKEFAAPR